MSDSSDLLCRGGEGSTSGGLIARTLLGSQDAQSQLHDIYSPLVYSWIRRSNLQTQDAYDVTQQVFVKVYKQLASFDSDKGKFRAWLWTITKNQIIEHCRNAKRYHSMLELIYASGFPAPPEATSSKVPAIVAQRALEVFQDRLSGKSLRIAIAAWIEGQTTESIAQDLETTRNAVYAAKSRALKLLREVLAELEFPQDGSNVFSSDAYDEYD